MNDKRPNEFDKASGAAPEQRPLDEHLDGINAKSNGAAVKTAAISALGDSWSRADVYKALETRGVSKGKIKNALPPAPKPHVVAATGLPPGYFRKDDESVWTFVNDPATGEPIEIPVCNYLKVLYRTTDGEGDDASRVVEVINVHGEKRQTRLKVSQAYTDVRAAISQLTAAGLIPARRGDKPYAEILDMILNADVSRARYLTETGHCSFQGVKAFALPSGVLGATADAEVIWDGGTRQCRVSVAGTLDGWRTEIAAPCDGNAIPMVAIGAMLASPAIPFLPQIAEKNTTIHLVEVTTTGKTTSLRVGASVWGKGADTSDPKSFVETWKTTGNASENLLAGHNHVGLCLDELKIVDAKAAGTWAYDFATGRGKHRMNRDNSARARRGWELFPLSSGNVTLEDRAADATPMRRRSVEGGADVRVLNIPAHVVFTNLHGSPDAKTFAEQLAASAATTYGHAGPAYVEWLLANPARAKEVLENYWSVWRAVAEEVLPSGASAQARRVASRLGSIACAGALGAEVLELPWTDGGKVKPAQATLRAFAKVLKLWLGENGGGGMSTELTGLNNEFRNLYESQRAHFYTSDDSHLSRPEPCWGYRAVGGALGETARLLHVDVLLGTFSDPKGLGWNKVQTKQFIRGLKARELLIPGVGKLQNTRSVDGRNVRIYRIKGEFFDE